MRVQIRQPYKVDESNNVPFELEAIIFSEAGIAFLERAPAEAWVLEGFETKNQMLHFLRRGRVGPCGFLSTTPSVLQPTISPAELQAALEHNATVNRARGYWQRYTNWLRARI